MKSVAYVLLGRTSRLHHLSSDVKVTAVFDLSASNSKMMAGLHGSLNLSDRRLRLSEASKGSGVTAAG